MTDKTLLQSMLTLLAALLLIACTPSQMRDEGRFYMSDAGLLDS